MYRKTVTTLACAVAILGFATAAYAEDIQILYEDRPPYYVTDDDGALGGLVGAPVTWSIEKAGIEARWLTRASKRQIENVKSNKGPICSPGWFKKPEREAFAKFSDPIYQDRPQVIVIRADNAHRFTHSTLPELFNDTQLRLGVKLGYSYGGHIDDLRASQGPVTVETTQDTGGMVRMLLGRRFDYLFASPEEFESLVDRLGIAGEDLSAIEFREIPKGNKRYLMCSKSVDDTLLDRFNAALAQYPDPSAASD